MNKKAVFFQTLALAVSVASLFIATAREEPTLLASSIFATFGVAVSVFFSLSKNKHMNIAVLTFLSACLLISAFSEIFANFGESYIGYLSRAPAYLGVGCLYLASLIAFFGLRLDRILTSIFIVVFEMSVSVSGAIAISIMKAPLLDSGDAGMIDAACISQQLMVGFLLAILASLIVFFYLKAKNIFLVTEDVMLEG
ncbi:MAG: hypothetical protein LBG63_01510 [Candidatus Methanoplasma sp.]|nr:hypothetical protein [Candidatus Methanoplasma sp.]